jgi:hypothetical protein
VVALRDYLAGRSADQPVWPGPWPEKAAEMFRLDLEAAGIPYVVEGSDGPLYAHFHSLRHAYIALLDRSGTTLKEAMQLARHSDPKLTMAVYGRAQLHDLGKAVCRFPSLLDEDRPGREALRATGTDASTSVDGPVCTGFVQTNDTGRDSLRLVETTEGAGSRIGAGPNHLFSQGVESACDGMMPAETSSGGWDRTTDTRLMKPLL